MRPLIEVLEDPAALAERAAALFARAAAETSGPFRVALAGGETPRAAYEALAREYARTVSWPRVEFFQGDERLAPPELSGGNHEMARRALLGPLGIAASRTHRIEPGLPAVESAGRYEEGLRGAFGLAPGRRPRFDLVLLGLGADGHTASLFPGSPALEEDARLAVAVRTERPRGERVTLTLPVLNAAARVLFIVSGAAKAAAARRALEGSEPPVPAGLVRPERGEAVWLLDAQAARGLTSRAGGPG